MAMTQAKTQAIAHSKGQSKCQFKGQRQLQRPLVLSFMTTIALPLIIAIASFRTCHVQAAPYILMTHFTPKCVNVEVPRDMLLTIQYDAPDVVAVPEDDGTEIARRNGRTELKKYMIDTTLTVTQKFGVNKNFDIKNNKGEVTYLTSSDEPVTMCIRSLTASPQKPSRIALTIDAAPPIDEEEEKRKKQQEESEKAAEHSKARRHLNSLQGQLHQSLNLAKMLVKNAEHAKEQDIKYHNLSESMNRASLWWPLIQFGVLMVTGVMQANYMLEYIKRRGL